MKTIAESLLVGLCLFLSQVTFASPPHHTYCQHTTFLGVCECKTINEEGKDVCAKDEDCKKNPSCGNTATGGPSIDHSQPASTEAAPKK